MRSCVLVPTRFKDFQDIPPLFLPADGFQDLPNRLCGQTPLADDLPNVIMVRSGLKNHRVLALNLFNTDLIGDCPRVPFEGTFSKFNHQARYRGRTKIFIQCVAEAVVHNLKKAVKVLAVLQPTSTPTS